MFPAFLNHIQCTYFLIGGRHIDLLVMDGSLKRMGYKYEEEGSMFREELTVKSVKVDEKTLESSSEVSESLN